MLHSNVQPSNGSEKKLLNLVSQACQLKVLYKKMERIRRDKAVMHSLDMISVNTSPKPETISIDYDKDCLIIPHMN